MLLKQALSLCGSLVDEKTRLEAAFFESLRTMIVRLLSGGTGKKFTLPEVNERINELLKHSIKSEGVINLFSDVKTEFSLFDPKFLEEIANMKEKNLAVELLKKLIAEQVSVYRRTNIVKSEKFSELIQGAMNRYLNGMLTNEEVIQELLKLAKEIADANAEGEKLGLNADELAFYDALTKPQAIKDFYEHDELIAITKELTDLLRKNRTIDWQKKESARAGMRRFPVPDPIIEYKASIAKDPLMDVRVPEMVIKLKQGIGRLIRNFTDTGIVCIIDRRLRDAPAERYHDIAWASLPIKNRTKDLGELRRFYESLPAAHNETEG